ncbi:MAG: hypothetical protein FWC47_11600 [Oscillospiraceae bacterium]|nr:hypothetical protein [Oscillospiraceae bacterium]
MREMTKEKEAMENHNSVFITIPSQTGRDKLGNPIPSIHPFQTREGKFLAEVTLPADTFVKGQDVSFYSFIVSANQIDPGKTKRLNIHSILLPEKDEKDEPWNIVLKRDIGSYSGEGKWEANVKEVTCTSKELKESTDARYSRAKKRWAVLNNSRNEVNKSITSIDKNSYGTSLNGEIEDARKTSAEISQNTNYVSVPATAPINKHVLS